MTPNDIAQVVCTLGPDELADLRQRLQDHGLILEWAEQPPRKSGKGADRPAQTLYESPVMDKEALTPDENVPEFWKLIDVEPLPKPPPPTPEGDKIALAALDKVHGLFPITDPELGYWIAESEEAAIYNAHHYEEESSEPKK